MVIIWMHACMYSIIYSHHYRASRIRYFCFVSTITWTCPASCFSVYCFVSVCMVIVHIAILKKQQNGPGIISVAADNSKKNGPGIISVAADNSKKCEYLMSLTHTLCLLRVHNYLLNNTFLLCYLSCVFVSATQFGACQNFTRKYVQGMMQGMCVSLISTTTTCKRGLLILTRPLLSSGRESTRLWLNQPKLVLL